MRFVLKVSYDGTDFCGWQIQPNGRSVQGVLEEVAESIFGVKTEITGSGRTDSGVHAKGQICQFEAETSIPAGRLRECFNLKLPSDVKVLKSATAQEGFDCTRNAKKKTYAYSFYVSPCELPLIERYSAKVPFMPDLERMREIAQILTGEHDFKAFRASGATSKTTVRTVYSIDVEERKEEDGVFFTVKVCGNGFLYNMVRIIAGTLYAVGIDQISKENVVDALKNGERKLLGKTMPAKGLTMISAEYDIPLFSEE